MNLYFLVEGRRSEARIYPEWLAYLLPQLRRIRNFDDVEHNHYFLIDGGGYPSIYNHLKNAVAEVNSAPRYDYLILCLDADESTVEERIQQIDDFMKREGLKPLHCHFKIVVQNRCLETWFLGNRMVYPRQPNGEIFRQYCRFFDVSADDPELMGVYKGFTSISLFHYSYLKAMLAERNIQYTKSRPRAVVDPPYIDQLVSRVDNTDHLKSLKDFFDFCTSIKVGGG
jgi:hypothetical protein